MQKQAAATPKAIRYLALVIVISLVHLFSWQKPDAVDSPKIADATDNTFPPAPVTLEPARGKYNSSHVEFSIPHRLSPDQIVSPRVLLVSYLFMPPEKTTVNNYLRMFLESARYSGVELAIVGNWRIPQTDAILNMTVLPPNVQFVYVTWEELIDHMEQHIFSGSLKTNETAMMIQELRSSRHYYKVNDYKPIFAKLFPEIIQDYDWWGTVDNDVLLGDIRHFLNTPKPLLTNYDVISGIQTAGTWGPFTMYRNNEIVNNLYQSAERPLSQIFLVSKNVIFDEWGSYRMNNPRFNSSMAGIVKREASLGLIRSGFMPMGWMLWDGVCRLEESETWKAGRHCTQCTLSIRRDAQQPRNDLRRGQGSTYEALGLCHFQDSKKQVEVYLSSEAGTAAIRQFQHGGDITLSFEYHFLIDLLQAHLNRWIVRPAERLWRLINHS